MPPLLELLHTGKIYWLTVPRYAAITLPIVLAGVIGQAGFRMAALLSLSVSVLACARLVWFKRLPHEIARLGAGEHALASAKPDTAIAVLQRPLPFGGMQYKVERAVLLAHAHVRKGQFIEAHRYLNALNEHHLLQDERLRLQCAWALLFLEADNPAEALRRLEEVAEKDCTADIGCLLLKAELELQQDRFMQARTLLETGLDRCQEAGQRIRLLNNLARIEGLQGRFDAQLRYLQAARTEYRTAPRVDLTDIVHHNLAIALVRAGQRDEAREVLSEAWAAGDTTDLYHAITVLNNHLYAAREAGDADWKREVHQEFERQLIRLAPRTPREQLALDASQLRARRNDEIPLTSGDYPGLIGRLLHSLDTPQPAIPESDRVAALVEIRHDLKREIQAAPRQTELDRLIPLLQRAARQLLDHRPTIDAHLSTLSPKLIGPLVTWHRYRTDADKARIEQADSPEAWLDALTRLFSHLREKAEWLGEQGTVRQAVEAWLVICDEYLAYHDQLPVQAQPSWCKDYLELAQHALGQASARIEGSKIRSQHIDHMIGLAYFNLRLRQDATTAARWVRIIEEHKPSLDHFAGWLRVHYAYVCRALGTGKHENKTESR